MRSINQPILMQIHRQGIVLCPIPEGCMAAHPVVLSCFQMACLVSAKKVLCETGHTSRLQVLFFNVCRMCSGILWHKVNVHVLEIGVGGGGMGHFCTKQKKWRLLLYLCLFGDLLCIRSAMHSIGQSPSVFDFYLLLLVPLCFSVFLVGLSWQDDLTQYMISREMDRIPRFHLPSSREPVTEDRYVVQVHTCISSDWLMSLSICKPEFGLGRAAI